MTPKYKLIHNPTKEQFEELEKGLKTEFETFETGFYINWHVIGNCFKKKKLILFDQDSIIVGFVIPTVNEIKIQIEIFQILKPYENKGLGTLFFNLFAEFANQKKVKVFSLNCDPVESEKFWRKQGFLPLEIKGKYIPRLSFFKPLIDISIPVNESDSGNKIEIWDEDFHLCKVLPPKWIFETQNGFKPILMPIRNEWKLRWTKNGIIQYDNVLKNFSEQFEIDFSPFVFIEKLPE